jgi:hypothetical protein
MPLAQPRAGAHAELAEILRRADGDRHRPAGERPEGQFGEPRDDEAVNGDLVAGASRLPAVAQSVHGTY